MRATETKIMDSRPHSRPSGRALQRSLRRAQMQLIGTAAVIVLLGGLLFAAAAQSQIPVLTFPPRGDVADLGTCTDDEPKLRYVIDGASGSDCSTGLGSSEVLCECKAGTWGAFTAAAALTTIDADYGAETVTSIWTVTGAWTLALPVITGPTFPTYIDITPTESQTHAEGRMYYDSDDDTFVAYSAESDVGLNIGQESWVYVRNETGVAIANGALVYVTGASGNRPTIAPALADDPATSHVLGVATHSIENNTDGYVTSEGLVNGLKTDTFLAGDPVYLSAVTPGAYTNTAPTGNNVSIEIGVVTRVNPSVGAIYVHTERDDHLRDDAVSAAWNGITRHSSSLNALHDYFVLFDPDLDGDLAISTDSISQGNSSVAVIDAGTGQVDVTLDAGLIGSFIGSGWNAGADCVDSDQDGTCEVVAVVNYVNFDPDDDGTEEARVSATQFQFGTLGSVGAPVFTFTADPNTGVYSGGADIVGIAAGGVVAALFTESAGSVTTLFDHFIHVDVATGDRMISEAQDTDTGLEYTGADSVSLVAGGVGIVTATEGAAGDDYAEILSDATTVSNTDQFTLGIAKTLNDTDAEAGTQEYRGIKLNLTETDTTGWDAVYLMDLQVNTASRFSVDNAGNVVTTGTITMPDGTTTVPTLHGTTSTTSGISVASSGVISIIKGGALQVAHRTSPQQFRMEGAGSAGNPRISDSTSDTGIFFPSGTELAFVADSVEGMRLSEVGGVVDTSIPTTMTFTVTDGKVSTPNDTNIVFGDAGASSSSTGGNGVAIGHDAVAGLQATAIGAAAASAGNYGVAIGYLASTTGNAQTAVGFNTHATAGGNSYGDAFGYSANAGGRSISIGGFSDSTTGATALGWAAQADQDESIALGNAANTETANELTIGAVDYPINRTRTVVTASIETGVYILDAATTNADETELDRTEQAGFVDVPSDSTFGFDCTVTARRTDVDGESAFYRYEGALDNDAGTTALVAAVTETVIAEDTAAWVCAATADDTNDRLALKCTGEVGKSITWVGRCETTEVTG